MGTASKTLVVAGLLNLAYGFLLGLPLSMARMKSPQAPRYLVLAHLGPIMSAPILLSLVVAVGFSDLSAGVESVAAWLLAFGSACLVIGDTMNWIGKVEDAFRDRSLGWKLTGVSAVSSIAGLAILLFGVLRAL